MSYGTRGLGDQESRCCIDAVWEVTTGVARRSCGSTGAAFWQKDLLQMQRRDTQRGHTQFFKELAYQGAFMQRMAM